MTKLEFLRIAELAGIPLSDSEAESMADDVIEMFDMIEQMDKFLSECPETAAINGAK